MKPVRRSELYDCLVTVTTNVAPVRPSSSGDSTVRDESARMLRLKMTARFLQAASDAGGGGCL
jgi:hypothetical protein